MQLSKNGKVVIVDNVFTEAKPLLDVLNMNQIPYLYFDGKVDSLPETPCKGIRFVFLDIALEGMDGADTKTKASAIVGILEKIISKDNGPYAIIFWTKHPEVIERTLKNCQIRGIKPVISLDLDKSECKEGETYSLKAILEKLKTKAEKLGPYSLYIMWENIAADSGTEFINSFANIFEFDDNWSENTRHLFYRLYKAYTEKNEVSDDKDKILCVLQLINRSFKDLLDNNTVNCREKLNLFEFPSTPTDEEEKRTFSQKINEIISDEIIAKINNSLFIIDNPDFSQLSTVVFKYADEELKNIFLDKCFEKISEVAKASAQLCRLVITPQCDICQDKAILHRVLYGIIFNEDDATKCRKGPLFPFGPFYFHDSSKSIVFHLQSITTCKKDELCSKEVLFGLRKDLFFDIQANSANHVNRHGNFAIKKQFKI